MEEDIKRGLNILLFLVVPSMAVLTIYSEDVVRLIFEYGKFNGRAVKITAESLFYYSLGLYFYTAIGISISTVIYPALSKKIVNKNFEAVEEDIKRGLNILLFLVVPSMAVLTIYSEDVVRLIFEYGKFNGRAVKITAESLFYYSLGLYFYTAIYF